MTSRRTPNRCALRAVALALCLALVGCGSPAPTQFRMNMFDIARDELPASQQRQVARVVRDLFGTPDEPVVVPASGLDIGKLRRAAGSARGDGFGHRVGLYRAHCAPCHGITGDGYGPLAALLNPYPRDFREGKFKFKSTAASQRPTCADLIRILDRGIPGTAMPAYRSLTPADKEALVEYVCYLSVRGEMETALVDYCADELDEQDSLETEREVLIKELLVPIVRSWRQAPRHVVQPPIPAARHRQSPDQNTQSAARGRALFYGKRANCFTCHDETVTQTTQNREFADEYDDWNKRVRRFLDNHKNANPCRLGVLAPRKITPRNLRSGVLRGGDQESDVYRRIHAGIDGTPMPAVGPLAPGGKGVLTPTEIWNLVDYVRRLPTEPAGGTKGTTPVPGARAAAAKDGRGQGHG